MKSIRVFENIYDFYKLPDKEARQYIGHSILEKYKVKHKVYRESLYFPVGLSNEWENYGKKTGLIYVSEIWTVKDYTYFRVAAFSPDDLDLALEFNEMEVGVRGKVLDFMYSLPFDNTSYREVLDLISNHVGCGEIGY